MNHGVRPDELRDVETIWESLDLGFAADDTALKLCIEEGPGFRHFVHFPRKLFNYFVCIWPNFVLLCI